MKSLLCIIFLCVFVQTQSHSQSYFYTTKPTRTTTLPSEGFVNPNTTYNNGYIKSNGTYVAPHTKTQSNQTNWDNYSTQDNSNPYTQEKGSKAKDYSIDAYNYGPGKVIQTGERGGQYYINDNGNKVYVPKR